MHGSVQDEADDVAEVLRVQRATWGAPHVATDGHGDLPHLWVAVVTTCKKEERHKTSGTLNKAPKSTLCTHWPATLPFDGHYVLIGLKRFGALLPRGTLKESLCLLWEVSVVLCALKWK